MKMPFISTGNFVYTMAVFITYTMEIPITYTWGIPQS